MTSAPVTITNPKGNSMFSNPTVIGLVQGLMAVIAAISAGKLVLDFSTPVAILATVAALLTIIVSAWQGTLVKRASLTDKGELYVPVDTLARARGVDLRAGEYVHHRDVR